MSTNYLKISNGLVYNVTEIVNSVKSFDDVFSEMLKTKIFSVEYLPASVIPFIKNWNIFSIYFGEFDQVFFVQQTACAYNLKINNYGFWSTNESNSTIGNLFLPFIIFAIRLRKSKGSVNYSLVSIHEFFTNENVYISRGNTELFLPYHPNIYQTGQVCLGHGLPMNNNDPYTLVEEIMNAFWTTDFNSDLSHWWTCYKETTVNPPFSDSIDEAKPSVLDIPKNFLKYIHNETITGNIFPVKELKRDPLTPKTINDYIQTEQILSFV